MKATNLYISETHVNATEHYVYNELSPYETRFDTIGDLYRSLQREYGKCISAMYIDYTDRVKTQKIGYVFQSRTKYENNNKMYLREVWIRIFTKNEDTGELTYVDLK